MAEWSYNLPSLKVLDLSYNEITEIKEIHKLHSLESLNLSNNDIWKLGD